MMFGFWIEREFFEKKEEEAIVKQKEPLKFRAISYEGARAKYKFNMYWRKNSNIPEYRLSTKSPGILWTQMSGLPANPAFEEARTKEFHIVRFCKDGVYQPGAFMKIPAPEV